MGAKNAFLNGYINEEVYVKKPLGFEDKEFLDHIFKLTKSVYGLIQALRAWYERLSNFLLKNSFERGQEDTTLFIK